LLIKSIADHEKSIGGKHLEKYKVWIGGKWVEARSGKTFPTYNPATGEEISLCPICDKVDVDEAVKAARSAFPAWANTAQAERSRIVNKIAAAIRDNAEQLTRTETLEHGTPVQFVGNIIGGSVGSMEYAASAARALSGEVISAMPGKTVYLRREPIGVCALITPWNHGLFMIAEKLGQALATGNTVVIKPPSVNSMIGIRFMEVLSKLDLPEGLINIVTGSGGTVGNYLASHPDIDLIDFTGSSETGKSIMAAASQTMKKLIMELGGKNPIVVLEDADVDAAVKHHAHEQYHNSGMHCSNAGRYYVHEKRYDEFVKKFIAASRHVVMGDPTDKNTFMGPVASSEHRDRVENYIKSGLEQGANLILRGEKITTPPFNKGFFVPIAVFTDVAQDMKIGREEIFGPVAIIMKPFSSESEVIKLANDTRYGLAAVVWTKDNAKALKFVNELHAGAVWVNNQKLSSETPWGGYKESGLGKDGGFEGLKDFTQLKLVCMEMS
jgi:acyl-CoA reductase-like NAD-dependent aldehyde dehydrogenase